MHGSDDESPSLLGLNFGKLNVRWAANDDRLYLFISNEREKKKKEN